MLPLDEEGNAVSDDFPHIDLSVLTARQREVIEMHYSGRLSFGQIALFMGSSYKAVNDMHYRAIRKLREGNGHYKVDA